MYTTSEQLSAYLDRVTDNFRELYRNDARWTPAAQGPRFAVRLPCNRLSPLADHAWVVVAYMSWENARRMAAARPLAEVDRVVTMEGVYEPGTGSGVWDGLARSMKK